MSNDTINHDIIKILSWHLDEVKIGELSSLFVSTGSNSYEDEEKFNSSIQRYIVKNGSQNLKLPFIKADAPQAGGGWVRYSSRSIGNKDNDKEELIKILEWFLSEVKNGFLKYLVITSGNSEEYIKFERSNDRFHQGPGKNIKQIKFKCHVN